LARLTTRNRRVVCDLVGGSGRTVSSRITPASARAHFHQTDLDESRGIGRLETCSRANPDRSFPGFPARCSPLTIGEGRIPLSISGFYMQLILEPGGCRIDAAIEDGNDFSIDRVSGRVAMVRERDRRLGPLSATSVKAPGCGSAGRSALFNRRSRTIRIVMIATRTRFRLQATASRIDSVLARWGTTYLIAAQTVVSVARMPATSSPTSVFETTSRPNADGLTSTRSKRLPDR